MCRSRRPRSMQRNDLVGRSVDRLRRQPYGCTGFGRQSSTEAGLPLALSDDCRAAVSTYAVRRRQFRSYKSGRVADAVVAAVVARRIGSRRRHQRGGSSRRLMLAVHGQVRSIPMMMTSVVATNRGRWFFQWIRARHVTTWHHYELVVTRPPRAALLAVRLRS